MKKNEILFIASLFLILIPRIGNTQLDTEKWQYYIGGVEGGSLFYNYESLKRENFPPTIITAKVLQETPNKPTYHFDWEMRCQTKELKISSRQTISIASDTTSLRRLLLEGLCGINNDEGLWFLVSHLPNGFYGINSNTLKKISNDQYSYISSFVHVDANNQFKLTSAAVKDENIINCSDRSRAQIRAAGSNDPMKYIELPKSAIGRTITHLVCSNYIQASNFLLQSNNDSNITQPNFKENNSIESAKHTCLELGFKEKTEKFAECVLKISR